MINIIDKQELYFISQLSNNDFKDAISKIIWFRYKNETEVELDCVRSTDWYGKLHMRVDIIAKDRGSDIHETF